MKFIDLHCDTLMNTFLYKKDDMYETDGMVDFKRMKEAGQLAQFFAMYMLSPDVKRYMPEAEIDGVLDEDYIAQLSGTLQRNIDRYSDLIAFARNAEEMLANERTGKMSAFLTIEDGRSVNGSMENLKRYYDMGVRLISFTWNYANCFGWPNSDDAKVMGKGLTDFGKEAVGYMNAAGMLIDVSHLSDGGFWDVAEISAKPFVASHSNCRAICPHKRNLTDDMIRAVADKGGAIGMNFAPIFLGPDPKCEDSRVEMMSEHIRHMIKVGGSDVIALGSDLDGISGNLEIPDISKMYMVFDRLAEDGVGGDVIEKLAYKNALRVMEDSLA